ncbi:MAG: RNA polymerase sigma-70 factor [Odoribacter sp.]
MKQEEENEFMKQLSEKRPDAFRKLFLNFYNALCYYAMGYVKERERAEDIVQDLFTQIWESKTCYVSYTSFKTFLYTSVRNACVNLLKHKEVEKKYICYIRERETDGGEADDLRIMEEEVFRLLLVAVEELPPRCREVFEQVLQGKKNEEIAGILNVSPLTVKTQRSIGMRILKEKLGHIYEIMIFLTSLV